MAEGDSPTVARRRVRLALREAREAAGYTQLDVAEQMEWCLGKVVRIENGDVTNAPNDLRPLLTYLTVEDRASPSLRGFSNTVMYRETGTTDEVVEDEAVTTRHFGRYRQLCGAARTEGETRKRIRELR
ncbi:helix-turn-helix domain-containing protein [Actinoplanes sp. NPDC049681]|uniref:helix-turn-helix domain-containing protein n=1 Tax=Actinoplanes sp. NPDC049681 TaxID=3363905 RepID=UPI0037BD9BC4